MCIGAFGAVAVALGVALGGFGMGAMRGRVNCGGAPAGLTSRLGLLSFDLHIPVFFVFSCLFLWALI